MSRKIGIVLFVLFATASAPIHGAEFPAKELQIIVPWAPGGATDLVFRALAARTGKHLGKAVVVVNRPGGGGSAGYTEGRGAAPDGYTLVSAVTPLCILPHQVSSPFTHRDFTPVIQVVDDPSMFLVKSDSPWKGLKEFLEYARKNPDTIAVGNPGAGGGVHLMALAFEKAAGARFNHIAFPGTGPSVTALVEGRVNAVSALPPEAVMHVRERNLRIMALFAGERVPMSPDVPTVREQGVDFAMGVWRGLVAPKGTPPEVIRKLHDGFMKGMDDAAFRERAKDLAVHVSYLGPEEFGRRIARDHELFGKLVKETGTMRAEREGVRR